MVTDCQNGGNLPFAFSQGSICRETRILDGSAPENLRVFASEKNIGLHVCKVVDCLYSVRVLFHYNHGSWVLLLLSCSCLPAALFTNVYVANIGFFFSRRETY